MATASSTNKMYWWEITRQQEGQFPPLTPMVWQLLAAAVATAEMDG